MINDTNNTDYIRGFTLIELLVVVSIVSLLSSVIFASVASARVRAQDALRIQEIGQIDNAIALYISDKGHVPTLNDNCSIAYKSSILNQKCVARSNSTNSDNNKAWDYLKTELGPYIKELPSDPCGTTCATGQGYVYVAPAAMYAICNGNASVCSANSITDQSYEIYNLLMSKNEIYGKSTAGIVKDATVAAPTATTGSN